jgi:CDP-paratose 2-epimerase
MAIALVTGSSGLIGSESVRHFASKGFDVVGIDNDMRQYFFGPESSTEWMCEKLQKEVRNFI